ncbi:MAG: alpha-L-fucosidase, partial [Proteobacteria bacterium]|nr:alpha-L-fucosidase [Pseudomonadota bacterium]
MPFEPTLESLNAHRVPQWYEDAKFGIFIHWGLFSIPGFATRGGSISDTFRDNY